MTTNKLIVALASSMTALMLASCGTSEGTSTTDDTSPETVKPKTVSGGTSQECQDDDTTTSTDAVTLTDTAGNTVELEKPAKNVVILEWMQVEAALTLCINPIGVADIDGYTTWNSAEKLPADGVADVGTRAEPNLDAIVRTNPDLVIMARTAGDEDPTLEKLKKAGIPVVIASGAQGTGPIQNMKDAFNVIAQATGRTERAEKVLADFDAHLADKKKIMTDTPPENTAFVYFDGYLTGGNLALRPFGQESLVGELGEELGLTNAWTGQVDPEYGLGQTDIEGLSTVGDATLLRTGTDDPASDINPELEKNPVWQNLPAVKDDRAQEFPTGVWTFGGPKSAEQIVDGFVKTMSK